MNETDHLFRIPTSFEPYFPALINRTVPNKLLKYCVSSISRKPASLAKDGNKPLKLSAVVSAPSSSSIPREAIFIKKFDGKPQSAICSSPFGFKTRKTSRKVFIYRRASDDERTSLKRLAQKISPRRAIQTTILHRIARQRLCLRLFF